MRAVPRALDRVDLVIPAMLVLLVAHLVEDEELWLGSDVARVGDAGSRYCSAFRAMSLGSRENVARHRVDDVGDHADRRPGEKGSRRVVSASGTASMSDS